MSIKVLISPGFGAGWSTWASPTQALELATDPGLVALVEGGVSSHDQKEYCRTKWGEDVYLGGIRDGLSVEEVPTGSFWRVVEYDGSESIDIFDEQYWNKA